MNNKYLLGIISLIIVAGIVWWSTPKEPTPPSSPETEIVTTGNSIMIPMGTNGMGMSTMPETGLMPAENSMVHMGANDAEVNTVVYTDNGFSPAELTVKVGTTVTFINQRDAPMWVASGAHPTHLLYPEFDAKTSVPNGGTYSFTFNKIGAHSYHNHVLLGKYGKIIVE